MLWCRRSGRPVYFKWRIRRRAAWIFLTPLRHQEPSGNTERHMMAKAPPTPPFQGIGIELLLQFLVVPLDAPAHHRRADRRVQRRFLGQG